MISRSAGDLDQSYSCKSLTLSPSSTTEVPYANSLDLDETLSNLASHPDKLFDTRTFSPTLSNIEAF